MSMYSVWSWEGKHIATGSVMTYEEYDKFEDMIEAILSDFWDQGGESESNHAVEDMTAAAREFTKNNPDIILRLNYECTDDGNEFADFYFENGEEESCWASIEYPKPKKIVWPEKEPESNYCVDVGIRRFYKIYVTAESKAEAETNATKIALESDHEELILDPELDTENEDVEICGVYEM